MHSKSRFHHLLNLLMAFTLALGSLTALVPATPVAAVGTLDITVIAGYNLIVDSNVSSPSTYAPRVATVTGKFCNTGADPLTNVYGYIGNGITPGSYPRLNTNAAGFATTYPNWSYLTNTGEYFFRHVGATSDASRYIGTIPAGECRYQYWTIEYPACENVAGNWAEPPCTGDPTSGPSVKPEDDLSLDFHIWGTGYDASADATRTDSALWTMTMRNEISAMANKIEPNGNPAGQWFNTDTSQIRVGNIITTNGVLYSLGNVRFGFDNNGDYVPDYNAWLQPISQANYDPTCFRLIRTSGVLTVTRGGGNPPMILNFTDQLYFTDLPKDNTNVRGEVFYTFLALNGPCNIDLSPYQEVASGFDNEKFNGDYGAGIPPIISLAPEITIDKSSAPDTIAVGDTTTYRIPFANNGAADAGLTLSSGGYVDMPLTIVDTIPDGMQLASAATYYLSKGGTATILYSTDNGTTWITTAPIGSVSDWSTNQHIIIKWQLDAPLPKNSTGNYAQFTATVPSGPTPPAYTGTSFIENTACIGLGDAEPFACDTDVLKVKGDNLISGTVFEDNGTGGNFADRIYNDPAEGEIEGVPVTLYIKVGIDDYVVWDTKPSGADGSYSFNELPNGDYRIVVGELPEGTNTGWTITTDAMIDSVTLNNNDSTANNFGFAPALTLDKRVIAPSTAFEDQLLRFAIDLNNILPGNGTDVPGTCTYDYRVWATDGDGNGNWATYYSLAFDGRDDTFASDTPGTNADKIWSASATIPEVQSGNITKVEAIYDIYLTGTTADGNTDFKFQIFEQGTNCKFNDTCLATGAETASSLQSYEGISNRGPYSIEVTNILGRTWGWNDFSTYRLQIFTAKGNKGNPTIYLAQMGWRVTTNSTCGGDGDNATIVPLPLTDTYDATQLEFISANPAESSVTVNGSDGVITWDNLGPLYAGGTKTVEVTFRVKDGTYGQTIINTATVDNAYFSNGRPANDATDDASVAVNRTARLGDRVWNDVNGDGVQDPGEVGIPGVIVRLKPQSDVVIDGVTYNNSNPLITTTDSNGEYLFIGLPNANYIVEIDTISLPGSTFTQTGDPDLPNQTCTTCDNQFSVTLSGTDRMDADFGYRIPNTIHGTVWHDHNGDGDLGDATEISDVTVELYRWDAGTAAWVYVDEVETVNGRYLFSDINTDGNYLVEVDPSTLPDDGAGVAWRQTYDQDSNLDDRYAVLNVSGGNLYGSYDFGYYKGGDYKLSGTIYADWNNDNKLNDASALLDREPGFPDIAITLYDANGNEVARTTTDEFGYYEFDDLPPGGYTVVVTEGDLPPQYSQTEDPDNPGNACVSCNGRGTVTIVNADAEHFNFGYKPDGSGVIGDTVWRDMNGDGTQSGRTETGIENITVWLQIYLNDVWVTVAEAVTDEYGAYLFENLPNGDYRVIVNHNDSDVPRGIFDIPYAPSTPTTTGTITISGGNAYRDANFGFMPLGVIGDRVWQDNNGNGNQDEGEPGINGVTVGLYTWVDEDSDGVYDAAIDTISATPLDTKVTSGDGNYLFTGLPVGNYVVLVDETTLPSGFNQSGDPDWLEPCTGTALCDGASGVELRAGQIDMSRDFGYIPPGVIGDYIWFDANADGVQDESEGGIGFVTVQLCSDANCNTVLKTTETDSDGYYSFGNRSDGTYYVKVVETTLPASVVPTYDLDGIGTPHITTVILSGGGSNLTADFGYRYSGAYNISGTIFFDKDGNGGTYTAGDTAYGNITVYLWRDGKVVGEAKTQSNGSYSFEGLPAGDYTVSVDRNGNLGMMALTATPNTGKSFNTITGLNASNGSQQDFGFYAVMDMGDLPSSYDFGSGTTSTQYTTLFAYEGAMHINTSGAAQPTIYLGTKWDAEADGQPDEDAGVSGTSGDKDDEDGIEFRNTWYPGGEAQLRITITDDDTKDTPYVVGWFDWNQDGRFSVDEMHDFGNLAAGTHDRSVPIPGGAKLGRIYMRFRVYATQSPPPVISPIGAVENGEVEDYWRTNNSPTAVTFVGLSANGRSWGLSASSVLLALSLGLVGKRRKPRYPRED